MNRGLARRLSLGVSLIEAMVALAVMAFGMLGVGVMQSSLRLNADIARQRAEATRLAAEPIELARAYALVNTDPLGVKRAYADIVSVAATNIAGTNATYQRTVTVTDEAGMRYRTLHVLVTWKDRTNTDQEVRLSTSVHRAPPELSGSLIVPGTGVATQGGRHPTIPRQAVDNGDGTSTFTPPGGSGVSWVFNNMTGFISQRCTGTCSTAYGRFLQGYVAFDLTTPGTPDTRSESPTSAVPSAATTLAVSVAQTYPAAPDPVPALTPECFTEVLPAAPAVPRVVAYYCAVYVSSATGPTSKWSGRSQLVEAAPSLVFDGSSTTPTTFRMCRYSRLNAAVGSGTPPITNIDHPEDYVLVDQNLINQNFLVVPTGSSCPVDDTSTPFVNGNTWFQSYVSPP